MEINCIHGAEPTNREPRTELKTLFNMIIMKIYTQI